MWPIGSRFCTQCWGFDDSCLLTSSLEEEKDKKIQSREEASVREAFWGHDTRPRPERREFSGKESSLYRSLEVARKGRHPSEAGELRLPGEITLRKRPRWEKLDTQAQILWDFVSHVKNCRFYLKFKEKPLQVLGKKQTNLCSWKLRLNVWETMYSLSFSGSPGWGVPRPEPPGLPCCFWRTLQKSERSSLLVLRIRCVTPGRAVNLMISSVPNF